MVSISAVVGDDGDILWDTSFQILLLANTASALGLAMVSPVLDSMVEPLGVTAADIGLVMAAFTAAPVLMIPIAGYLADRYGRKPLIVVGLLLFGIGGTAIAFADEFWMVLVLRFLQGTGFAAITPIIITSLGDLFDGAREATAQGLRFTNSGIAQVLFPVLAGALVAFSWRYPFLLYAVAFPIAGVVYLWFDEPTAGTKAADAPTARAAESPWRALRELFAHRRVMGIVAMRVLPSTIWIGLLTYNSIIVIQFMGETSAEAGLLTGVVSMAFAATGTQAGRITAFFESRLVPLVASNLALAAGFAVLVSTTSFPLGLVGVAVAGFGLGVIIPIYRSIVTQTAPTAIRGTFVSLTEGLERLVLTATPILMGLAITAVTAELGFQGAVQFVSLGLIVLVCGGGILLLVLVHRAAPIDLDG